MAEHKKTVLTDLGPFIVYFVRVYSCTCHRRVCISERATCKIWFSSLPDTPGPQGPH